MANPHSVMMTELVMSAARAIDAAATQVEVQGAWGHSALLGHLSTVDLEVWIPRISAIADAGGQSQPFFVDYSPDEEATISQWDGVTVDEAAAALLTSRTRLVGLLRDISETDWDATGIHPDAGPLSINDLVMRALAHDESHRATMLGL